MATPESAKHRDLEQRFRDIEKRLRDVTTVALKRMKLAVDEGDFLVSGGGSVVVEGGGNVEVTGTGAVKVWGDTTVGTMENGRFGVATHTNGVLGHPSTVANPDGFLCDAGPGKGYAVYRVDEATGMAVVASSVGRTSVSHQETSDGANCRILLNGEILRVVSSRRYKREIRDADVDPAAVLAMRGRTWRDKADVAEDPNTGRRYVGFIAEELDELGLTEFVDYDVDGLPQAIQYDRVSVALLALAQHQQTQLDDLGARVTALEAAGTSTPPTPPRR